MNKPILLCVQPYVTRFIWEVEVMMHNFISIGIPEKFDVHLLFVYNEKDPKHQEYFNQVKLIEDGFNKYYPDSANFYYYPDTRSIPNHYPSSLRPNALKQHFAVFPKLANRTIFYHDCDVIFTKFPDFILDYNIQDNNWYVSDTRSYISHSYILSKGQDVMDKMCEIVGIPESILKERENQSGGAQYILKGVNYEFWNKVEVDCERLYKEITELNNHKKALDPNHHELQIWCADMWALLWNAWLKGYNTNIIPEMDFCWATDDVERYGKTYIYHDAGVDRTDAGTMFFKYEFDRKLPYNLKNKEYSSKKAGFKYFLFVQEVGRKSFLHTKSKILQIVDAYAALLNPTQERKEISEKRIEECLKCEYFEEGLVDVCQECFCPIKAKIFSENPHACREGKWKI